MNKLTVVCFLVFFSGIMITAQQIPIVPSPENCNVTREEANNCARKILIFGDRSMFIPSNANVDMDKHCNIMKQSVDCLKRHAGCYRNMARHILSVFVISFRKMVKKRCETDLGKLEFLSAVNCVRNNEIISNELNQCTEKANLDAEKAQKTATANHPLASSCCWWHNFYQCAIKSELTTCELESDDSNRVSLSNRLSRVLQRVCGTDNGERICAGLILKPQIFVSNSSSPALNESL